MGTNRLPYIWDYDIDEGQLGELLDGTLTMGRLDQRWAAIRLLEYAPYSEIVRLLGFRRLVEGWPEWRSSIRSQSRRRVSSRRRPSSSRHSARRLGDGSLDRRAAA